MPKDFNDILSTQEVSSWGDIWTTAFTRPSVATFENLVRNPQANSQRAYKWMFVSALVGYTIPVLSPLVRGVSPQWLYLLGVPILALIAVLLLMLMAGITQLVARAMGGTGTYSQMVYAFAAFNAPTTVITGIIFTFPFGRLVIGIYWFVLNLIAIKAINRFGWGKAVVSTLPILAGVVLILLAAFAIIFANPSRANG